jgi:hypothetical protein
MKVKKSVNKVRNLVIGSFIFIVSLMVCGASIYFITQEKDVEEVAVEQKKEAYDKCVMAGKLRNFVVDETGGVVTFYHPNLRNTIYSSITAMVSTTSVCEDFTLVSACSGPGCKFDKGVGIPFSFTLRQNK